MKLCISLNCILQTPNTFKMAWIWEYFCSHVLKVPDNSPQMIFVSQKRKGNKKAKCNERIIEKNGFCFSSQMWILMITAALPCSFVPTKNSTLTWLLTSSRTTCRKKTKKKHYTPDIHIRLITANQRPAHGQNGMIDSTIWPCENGGGL